MTEHDIGILKTRQAVTPPHLPAGYRPVIVVDGIAYVARMHPDAWVLAGRPPIDEFYGFALIDDYGYVEGLYK